MTPPREHPGRDPGYRYDRDGTDRSGFGHAADDASWPGAGRTPAATIDARALPPVSVAARTAGGHPRADGVASRATNGGARRTDGRHVRPIDDDPRGPGVG